MQCDRLHHVARKEHELDNRPPAKNVVPSDEDTSPSTSSGSRSSHKYVASKADVGNIMPHNDGSHPSVDTKLDDELKESMEVGEVAKNGKIVCQNQCHLRRRKILCHPLTTTATAVTIFWPVHLNQHSLLMLRTHFIWRMLWIRQQSLL